MITFREGSSKEFPWGIETTIHLEENGEIVNTIVVMHWPSTEEEKNSRGNHLISNYLNTLSEQGVE